MKRKLSVKLTKWDWFDIAIEFISDFVPVWGLFMFVGLVLQDLMRTYNYTDTSVSLAWVCVLLSAAAALRYMGYVKNTHDRRK